MGLFQWISALSVVFGLFRFAEASCSSQIDSSLYISDFCSDLEEICSLKCAKEFSNYLAVVEMKCGVDEVANLRRPCQYCADKEVDIASYVSEKCLDSSKICTIGCAEGFSNYLKSVNATCGVVEVERVRSICPYCAQKQVDIAKYVGSECLSVKICSAECRLDLLRYLQAIDDSTCKSQVSWPESSRILITCHNFKSL
jgi:hypothetical protein